MRVVRPFNPSKLTEYAVCTSSMCYVNAGAYFLANEGELCLKDERKLGNTLYSKIKTAQTKVVVLKFSKTHIKEYFLFFLREKKRHVLWECVSEVSFMMWQQGQINIRTPSASFHLNDWRSYNHSKKYTTLNFLFFLSAFPFFGKGEVFLHRSETFLEKKGKNRTSGRVLVKHVGKKSILTQRNVYIDLHELTL